VDILVGHLATKCASHPLYNLLPTEIGGFNSLAKPELKRKNMDAKILIVDDEPAIRKLIGRYLVDAGYECQFAETVASAKEILASSTFDLLLSDLKMPGESGLDLIRFAKKQYPQMGRVMITGYGSPDIASEIMTVGVYGYIIKPVTKNVVLITVENALRHLRLDLHMHACKVELEKNVSQRTEKLTAIMSNLTIGVVMLDLDRKILEINKRMKLWFPNMALGTPTCCFQVMNRPLAGRICDDCPMTETFQTRKVSETTKTISTILGEREFRIVTSPILDFNGNVYLGIALYEDITEKMLLEKDLHQAQKFEAVGQLAAGIAHEINSPIQYIGDNVSFLKDSFGDIARVMNTYDLFWRELTEKSRIPEEMGQKLADQIEGADIAYLWEEIPKTIEQSLEGVRRVEKIVRAMKDFSHPGTDEKTEVDINKILESTITVCRNEWKYVAEVETDFALDLPLTPCFTGEISQVFLNIIVNGAHAIGDFAEGASKGKGKISIKTSRAENSIQIRISDTGGGIPKEIQDRVFDPFFTTKKLGKGTGQGLAIARRVVIDRHQGNLLFETEKDRGTTFVIELPVISIE
jgi:two-component system, NtrC family, sensor kinase